MRLALVSNTGDERAQVRIDRDGKLPGRGAYLCRDELSNLPLAGCAGRALRSKGFARALRRAVNVPGEIVESVSR